MIDFVDLLGPCHIPDKLFEISEKYQPPEPAFDDGTPWQTSDNGPDAWTLVETFNSSKGNSVHRVERRYNELRCTCQGFRIGKRGHCKHTDIVKQKLGI
jgi:hypothetical protein